jgi:hypothetical protein
MMGVIARYSSIFVELQRVAAFGWQIWMRMLGLPGSRRLPLLGFQNPPLESASTILFASGEISLSG